MTPAKTPTITAAPVTIEPRAAAAPDSIIKRYMLMSTAASCLPVPLIDVAAIMGFQLLMLKDLSHHYGIKFSHNRVKNILGSLAGSFGAAPALAPLVASTLKFIPGIGTAAGYLALPPVAAASTYAVGKVFNQHFASGGTFLDFDPQKTRAYYEEQFREGKKLAEDKKEAMA
jgi:uncharacterized protein (DUF697 family)